MTRAPASRRVARKINWKYVARRLANSGLILLVLSFFIYLGINLAPGDPTQIILGQYWSPERAEAVRESLGLNDPIYLRYLRWLWNALHGDFGRSYVTNLEVVSEIMRALPISLELALAALAISLTLGLTIGILAAVRQNSALDFGIRGFCVAVSSMPIFWLGLVLIFVLSVEMGLFPTGGRDRPFSIVLPALSLACYSLAGMVRMTRSTMLEVLRKEYVRTARANGLDEARVILKHALKNALIPIVTLSGLYLGAVIGSAIITEHVFAWPGLGTLVIQAVYQRDAPVLQAGVLTIAIAYTIINLALDILYTYLDPRIRYR